MSSLVTRLTGFDRVQEILETDREASGLSFIEKCNRAFDVRAKILGTGARPYRSTVFICNHHTGALDFLASFPALAAMAPELKVVMNKKLTILAPLAKIAIGVNSLSTGLANSEASEEISQHLSTGGNVMIFPAGKVAQKIKGQIEDSVWKTGITKSILKSGAQVVPVHIQARNPDFFYFIRRLLPSFSMLFLLRILKKNDNRAVVTIGKTISSSAFHGRSPESIMNEIRIKLYELHGAEK